MLLSFNWLKKYVHLPDSILPEEVAEKLKLATVEVEGIIRQGELLQEVVVGKVLSANPHPNADRLKVCQVNIGAETVQIVCGGSNVAAGMLTAVAKVGSQVRWHGQGELITLEPAKIRGVESAGMIAASDEIGLAHLFPKKDEKEIMDITGGGYRPGTPLATALGLNDVILEIDNKSLSHRPDLWGHHGMAREVAVLYGREVSPIEPAKIKPGKTMKLAAEVTDEKLCPRYMAVALSGVIIGESPAWLKQQLEAVGLRSINNIVDITNYVMLETGQPLHAFDADQIVGSKKTNNAKNITVRLAHEGEELTTLDGQARKLDSTMLVIADAEKAVAVAGVMGGQSSGISSMTTTIIFEAANFNATFVRTTAGRIGLRTDSSMRFEKSLDPSLADVALRRAVMLTLELCSGSCVASNLVDRYPRPPSAPTLEFSPSIFKEKIGADIPLKNTLAILRRLGFTVKEKKSVWQVKVPSWRSTKDISIPEDIVEEALRFYGYDTVPSSLPLFPIVPPSKNALRDLERKAAAILVHELGFTEVYNYSFVSEAQIKRFGDDPAKYLELDNPVSKEKPYVRRNLLLNLFENMEKNYALAESLKIFEIGKVFHADEAGPRSMPQSDELLPRQDTWLTAMYADKRDSAPFWEARRSMEVMALRLGLELEFQLASSRPLHPWQHPARTAWVALNNDMVVGRIYELHPVVLRAHNFAGRVGVCSLNLCKLAALPMEGYKNKHYVPFSTYPEVVRDIAFVIDRSFAHAEIVAAIKASDTLLKQVELFDVYQGPKLPPTKKSVAYRIVFAHPERTLKSEEVEAAEKAIKQILVKKFAAEMR